MKHRRTLEAWFLVCTAMLLSFVARLSFAQRSDGLETESKDSTTVTLSMQWQRGTNSHHTKNFVYLHTPCQNAEPCECSMSFKATNSPEFADYISSFGEKKIPVVFEIVHWADGRAKTTQLIRVGTWERDRFAHNDRLISVNARFRGDAIGEPQSLRLHGSEDCFPSSDLHHWNGAHPIKP
jgi:hypothetical protein